RLGQRLQAYRAPGVAPEPAEAFRQGQAVLCLAESAWVGRFQDRSSSVRGRLGICRVPGSNQVYDGPNGSARLAPQSNFVPYLRSVGWLGVMPRDSAESEAALALLLDLSSPKSSAETVLEPAWGGGVFRREHFKNLREGDAFGFGPSQVNALVESLRLTVEPVLINPVLRLRTPDERDHLRVLAEEVRRALLHPDTDAGQALKSVAQRWRELDQGKSVEQRRAEYRLSLSLPSSR